MEKNLLTSLEELSVDLDNHIGELTSIEEPLKNSLDTETLSIIQDGHEEPREVLLQDQVSAFRKLREDKEEVLRKLWEDWENVQLQLIGLAAEVLGQDALTFAQVRDEDLKPGQKEKLQNTLTAARRLFDEKGKHHEGLEQDLGGFQESISRIANKTEKAVVEMQQVSMWLEAVDGPCRSLCHSNTIHRRASCSKVYIDTSSFLPRCKTQRRPS